MLAFIWAVYISGISFFFGWHLRDTTRKIHYNFYEDTEAVLVDLFADFAAAILWPTRVGFIIYDYLSKGKN